MAARPAGTHVRAVGGHVKTIKAVPQTYRGVRFRSTLEADWAASLDALGIAWSYEPEAVQLPSGELYRPDFWLPEITTWLEVKGPHNDRIEKTRELAEAVGGEDWGDDGAFVIVGRAPLAGALTFEWATGPDEALVLQECFRCGHYWLNEWGAWGCRRHARGQGGSEHRNGAMYVSPSAPSPGAWSGMSVYPMARAPR